MKEKLKNKTSKNRENTEIRVIDEILTYETILKKKPT
jgi:hypothetical protein